MIRHPESFSEAKPAGFDGTFHWDFLKPAFAPTKIEPMDLDAIVERRGRFLVWETKNIGVVIPEGQRITLEALVDTGLFTVIVLRGKTQHEISGWEIWHRVRSGIKKEYREGSSSDLVACVKRWFEWASRQPGKWQR